MCGICGFSVPAGVEPLDEGRLLAMRESLTHRGPDDAGLLLRSQAGLAHRRLSIVDVAAGRQPMETRDGRYSISYNGEVYNHLHIRKDLEAGGTVFETRCDTEAVLQVCAAHWRAGIPRLNGMFAFAIWDEGRRRLLLARDRLGIKPLYYVHRDDGTLFFASEIKAFVAAGVVRPALDFAALPDFLANHTTTGEMTLFQGVKRLLPGHTLEWSDGEITTREYWDLPERGTGDRSSEALQLARFEESLSASVEARLMADVPLGVFLSGGIDSAAITSLMAELRGPGISTFSVAFAEREGNELAYARSVARRFKTEHAEVVVSPEDFFRVLPSLVWHEDTPLAHPSSVPLHFVSMLAAERVKVVLSGEGSDELLGGYGRYWKTLVNHRLGRAYGSATPEAFQRWLGARLRGMGPGPARDKLGRTFLALGSTVRELYFENFSVFGARAQASLLSEDTRSRVGELDPYRALMEHLNARPEDDLLHRLLYADLKTYLHELLMKQDQMSMSASLESRVPFLDHSFVEMAWRLPRNMKLRGRQTKWALRRAMRDRLPEEILKRPKMGFPVPLGRWLRTDHQPLLDELVTGPRALERGIFDPAEVRRLCTEHRSGRRNHADRLWALLTLEIWHRIFVDGEAPRHVLPEPDSRPLAATRA